MQRVRELWVKNDELWVRISENTHELSQLMETASAIMHSTADYEAKTRSMNQVTGLIADNGARHQALMQEDSAMSQEIIALLNERLASSGISVHQ